MERIIIALVIISMASAELVFMDDFDYAVGRDDTNAVETFQAHGWAYAKTEQDTGENPGGYLYTVQEIPGYTSSFPGSSSNRVLAIESRPSQQEIIGGFLQQTDFYLQYGSESGSIGTIPPDVWFQFWLYNNDYGDQQSVFARSSKWIYPTTESYPCVNDMCRWLVSIGTADKETDGSYGTELGNGADTYISNRPPEAVFSGASEVPTNQDKLGSNLAPDTYIRANTWTLVKIHIDTSGAQGIYEMWLKELGGKWVKTAEWIGDVTPQFTWPIPDNLRGGHKMIRMPTTMNLRLDIEEGGDTWSYMDDFVIATEERDLPVYVTTQVCTGSEILCDDFEYGHEIQGYENMMADPDVRAVWNGDGQTGDGEFAIVAEPHTGDYSCYHRSGTGASTFLEANYDYGSDFYIDYWLYPRSDSTMSYSNKLIYAYASDVMDSVWCLKIAKDRLYNGDCDYNWEPQSEGWSVQYLGPGCATGAVGLNNLDDAVLLEDQWNRLVFHINMVSEQETYVEMWVDNGNGLVKTGEKRVTDPECTAKRDGVIETGRLKFGLMSDAMMNYNFDDLKVTNYAPEGIASDCTPAHVADNNPCNGEISLSELMAHINAWRSGQYDIQSVMEAIQIWKG